MQRASYVMLSCVLFAGTGCSCLLRGSDYLGGDAGDAGIDGGPIGNRPPIGSGVGLSLYRPAIGDTVRALVGPTYDPDGDAVSTTLRWTKNGDPLTATGVTLLVDPTMFVAGDRIGVEVTLNDGELDGAPLHAEAVVEADDTTRWRMLLPLRRGAESIESTLDEGGQRMLIRVSDSGIESLWEQQITDGQPARWARLFPSGTAPESLGGAYLYDRAGQRMLYYGGRLHTGGTDPVTDRLWALSLAERGREAWSELSASTPPPRQLPSFVYSSDGSHAWLYSGVDDQASPPVLGDVWEVDLASGRFTMLYSGEAQPKVGGVLLLDEAGNRLVLVGGGHGMVVGEEFIPEPTDEISTFDLANPSAGWQVVGTLPFTLIGGFGVIEGGRASVFLGLRDLASQTFNTERIDINLTDFSVELSTSTGAPQGLIAWSGRRAPFDTGLLVWTLNFDAADADFWNVDVATGTFSLFTGTNHDLPPPMYQASSAGLDGAFVVGAGRDGTPAITDRFWRSAAGDAVWEEVTGIADDPVAGAPEPRAGMSRDGSHPFENGEPIQLMGVTASGNADPMEVWRLESSRAWHLLEMSATTGMPGPREGADIFRGECRGPVGAVTRGNLLGVVAGWNLLGGGWMDETWMLNCELPEGPGQIRDCRWENPIDPSTTPLPARSWGAAALGGEMRNTWNRNVYVFGGGNLAGPLNDLWMTDNCASEAIPSRWEQVIIMAGAPPNARFGHSMTHIPVENGAPDDTPATILIFGGGTDAAGHSTFGDVTRLVPLARDSSFRPQVRYEPIIVSGEAIPGRMQHAALWDRVAHRLLVYGGLRNEEALDDLWELRIRP